MRKINLLNKVGEVSASTRSLQSGLQSLQTSVRMEREISRRGTPQNAECHE